MACHAGLADRMRKGNVVADLIAIGCPDETTAMAAADEARRLARDLIIQADAIAVTTPTWTTATSHPSFSGSVGPTRSRSALPHMKSTLNCTTTVADSRARLSGWVRPARLKINPSGTGQTDCGIRMDAYGTGARGRDD